MNSKLYNVDQLSDIAIHKAMSHYNIKLQDKLTELRENTINRYKEIIRITDTSDYVYVDDSNITICFKAPLKDNYLETPMSEAEKSIYDYIFKWTPNINPDIIYMLNCNPASTLRENIEKISLVILSDYIQIVTFYKRPATIRYLLKSYVGDNAIFTEDGAISKNYITYTTKEVKENQTRCKIYPVALYNNHRQKLNQNIHNAAGEFIDLIFSTIFVPPYYFHNNGTTEVPKTMKELIEKINEVSDVVKKSQYSGFITEIINFIKTSDDFHKSFVETMSDDSGIINQSSKIFEILVDYLIMQNIGDTFDRTPSDEQLYKFMRENNLAWDIYGNLIKR